MKKKTLWAIIGIASVIIFICLFMLLKAYKEKYLIKQVMSDFTISVNYGSEKEEIVSLNNLKSSQLSISENKEYTINIKGIEKYPEAVIYLTGYSSIVEINSEEKTGEYICVSSSDIIDGNFKLSSKTACSLNFAVYLYNTEKLEYNGYVSDEKIFNVFTDSVAKCHNIVLLDDICLNKNFVLQNACSIFTNNHTLEIKGDFIVDYSDKGKIAIHNSPTGNIIATNLFVNAPFCDFEYDNSFFDEKKNACIKANSYNGQKLSENTISVYSYEQLTMILLNLDKIYDYSLKFLFKNSFVFTHNVQLNVPISCVFENNVNFNSNKLNIITKETSTILINTSLCKSGICDNVFINAPFCDLIWEGSFCPDLDYIAQNMDVYHYLNTDMKEYVLGGIGKGEILSVSSNVMNNSPTVCALKWDIKDNIISVNIPFDITDTEMNKINLDIKTTDDCVFSFPQDFINNDGSYQIMNPINVSVIDSENNTKVYVIKVVREVCDIPVVYINTENNTQITSKETYLEASISIFADNVNRDYSMKASAVKIKGRGNSTWNGYMKKPFKIKFYEEESLMGLGNAEDWVLIANMPDKSLIRNNVASTLANQLTNIKSFIFTGTLVDVFLNGEYQGVYMLSEEIEVDENRVNIEEHNTNDDTGFLIEIGVENNEVLDVDYFNSTVLKHVTIQSPDNDEITKSQYDYIKDYINKTDIAIKNLDGYENYLDVDAFIDWVILHEFTVNHDSCFRRSCFITKEKGGKLVMGPIWDFDLAFGNFDMDKDDYQRWFTNGTAYNLYTWTTYLYKDPDFNKKYITRWNEVKQMLLDKSMQSIDELSSQIYKSQIFNFKKWDVLGKKLYLQPVSAASRTTYDEEVQFLKDFLNNRYEWLDNAINTLPTKIKNS